MGSQASPSAVVLSRAPLSTPRQQFLQWYPPLQPSHPLHPSLAQAAQIVEMAATIVTVASTDLCCPEKMLASDLHTGSFSFRFHSQCLHKDCPFRPEFEKVHQHQQAHRVGACGTLDTNQCPFIPLEKMNAGGGGTKDEGGPFFGKRYL